MKRTKKSSSTIKYNGQSIATSRKKTLLDHIPINNYQKYPNIKSSTLLPILSHHKFKSLQQNIHIPNYNNQDNLITINGKSQLNHQQKLSSIHQQINKLQKQIQEHKLNGKNKCKNYQQQLQRYDQLSNQITMIQNTIKYHKQLKQILTNRIKMFEQDYHSTLMNFQHNLAQKQYCDQVIQQYKRQYQNQSILVLDIFAKQNQIINSKNFITSIQQQINLKQNQLNQWKSVVDFDLQQKVIKNKITQLRIDLMKAQQQANLYSQTHKILKIRELLCHFIKQYLTKNFLILTSQQLNQQGIQIFICKNNLYHQFSSTLFNYRGKNKQKYEIKLLQNYFNILQKIYNNVNNTKYKLNKKIHQQYHQSIIKLRKSILIYQEIIKNNTIFISNLEEKLQFLFANQSLPLIQHLQQLHGKYQLIQIKTKLKVLKQQQKIRIAKIKTIYTLYYNLSSTHTQINHINFMNIYTQLQQSLKTQQNSLKAHQSTHKSYLSQKSRLQNYITLIVSKWNEISLKKQQLKHLYKQLNLYRQIKYSSKLSFNSKSLFNHHQHHFLLPKSQIISNTLKQTLKMRINGKSNQKKSKNFQKQNIHKNSNLLAQKNTITNNQFCKTRKPSLNRIKSAKFHKMYATHQIQPRDSLTALLMSKFVN